MNEWLTGTPHMGDSILGERVPQDSPGEIPGHGALCGTSAPGHERIDYSGATGLQHLLFPRYSNRWTEAHSSGPIGISPRLHQHPCYPWT
jgi:hypothetical protein